MNDETETLNEEVDRVRRTFPLTPTDYVQPFRELTAAAATFNDFESGDPQLMREALSNIRGIRQRALYALTGVQWLLQQASDKDAAMFAREPLLLLTELAEDMDNIERRITDAMIDGREAA